MAVGIDTSRLSPWAQKQILDKLRAQNAQRATQLAQADRERKGKYNNTPAEKATAEGLKIRFDSKREAARYDELMLMLAAGQIEDLRLQAEYTLQGAFTTPDGNRVRAIRYIADFTYRDVKTGETVVEDVKSPATKTRVYSIKRKLMREKYGIEIHEVM